MSNRPSRIGKQVLLFLILLAFLSAYGRGASKAVVFDFQSVGVDETTTKVASELLRNELTNIGAFEIVKGEGFCSTVEEAVQRSGELSADKAVMGSLSRLGEKVLVFASLVDVRTGKVEFSDQIVSVTVEDLDMVLKRLAVGLVEKKKLAETAEVGRIIEKESEEPRRRRSFFTLGAKAGYMFPIIGGYGGQREKMFTADLIAWYENPHLIVEPLAGLSVSGESQDLHGDISIYRAISGTDFSPYLGGGLGLHYVGCKDGATGDYEWNHGFATSVGGGIIGFRTYDFRILLNAKYSVVWAKLLDEYGQDGLTVTIGTTYSSRGGVGELITLFGLAGGALVGASCCLGCLGCLLL